ncbi:hypothetical protein YC2023_075822 [Brassica napus]
MKKQCEENDRTRRLSITPGHASEDDTSLIHALWKRPKRALQCVVSIGEISAINRLVFPFWRSLCYLSLLFSIFYSSLSMTISRVFFSYLKTWKCSSVVEARLLRYWEARNVKRGELMWDP